MTHILVIQTPVNSKAAPQQTQALLKPEGQPVKVPVQPHSQLAIVVDGVPLRGKRDATDQAIKLRKQGRDLQVLDKDDQPLVELQDFFARQDVVLEGQGWNYTASDSLMQNAVGVTSTPEGLAAYQSDVAAVGLSGTGAVAESGMGAVLGGLIVGLGMIGTGGGGGAAGLLPTGSTLVKGIIAAGPITKDSGLTVDLYDIKGVKLNGSPVPVSEGGAFQTVVAGMPGVVIAVVRDKDTGNDYIDETTGKAADLTINLAGMGVAQAVDGSQIVNINLNVLTKLAAERAGLVFNDKAEPVATALAAITDSAKLIAAVQSANNTTASVFGVADLMAIAPTLIIGTDGKANSTYNDADTVSGSERYAQVLAMLSGLESKYGVTEAQNKLQAALATSSDVAAQQKAIGDLLTQGAVQFEFISGSGTASYANLLNAAAGVSDVDNSGNGSASSGLTGLVADVIGKSSTAQVTASSTSGLQSLSAVATALQAMAKGTASAEQKALLGSGLTDPVELQTAVNKIASLGVTGLTTDNLAGFLLGVEKSGSDGAGADTLVELQAMVSAVTNGVALIRDYAQNNGGTAPGVDTYAVVGVTGVTASNVAAINAALATAPITGTEADSVAEVQKVVDAYNKLLDAADGGSNTGIAPGSLSTADYAAIGANIGNATSDPENLNLLNDVLGGKNDQAIDTPAEIEALAATVNAVQALAALNASDPIPAALLTQLTPANLAAIGVNGVTAGNLNAVLAAIQRQDNSGVLTDSVAELNALVAGIEAAAEVLVNYARDPQATNPAPQTPTLDDYLNAGVSGVTAGNLTAINSALADADVHPARAADVQLVVDAYNHILQAADAGGSTGSNPASLTAGDFTGIGVNLDTTPSSAASAANDPETLALLKDLVGQQTVSGVDSVAEVQKLADIANAIQALAALAPGEPVPAWIDSLLSPANMNLIGMTEVTADNRAAVLAGIQAAANDGSATQSLADLNGIVSTALTALGVISAYADANGGTVPTASDYALAGITGLSDVPGVDAGTDTLAAFNSALASGAITGAKADTPAEIQAIVNSFNNILKAADSGAAGSAGDGSIEPTALTRTDFANIGVNLGAAGTTPAGDTAFALVQDIIGQQADGAVDTTAEVQNLVDLANALQALAEGTATPAQKALLTPQSLTLLGLQNVTPDNIGSVIEKIEASTGDLTNSMAELQGIVNGVNDAIDTLVRYAANPQTNTVDPTADTYAAAGIEGVSGSNLSAINAALADPDANPASQAGLQALVDSYNKILGEANGAAADATTADPLASDYTRIGVNLSAGTGSAYDATDAATDAETLALLNDVLGGKTSAEVDTPAKIEALAATVNALQALAALQPDPVTGVISIPADLAAVLTKDALNALGLTPAVTDATLSSVLAAIVRAGGDGNDGSATDSVAELNALVSGVTNSLNVVTAWAADPATGTTAPSVTDYTNIGVLGVDASNRSAINSALADADVHPTDAAGVQAVVNAYNSILQHADAGAADSNPDPSAATYTAIGVNLGTAYADPALSAPTLGLLNDIVSSKDTTAVDTVVEVQNLADTANAIQALAGLNPEDPVPQWITDQLTPANLAKAGIENVTAGNLAGVLSSIQAAANTGVATDSLTELNALVNNVNAAVDLIGVFADNNASSKPLPSDGAYGSFAYSEGSTVLGEIQFAAAGIRNVTASNLSSVKDALATAGVTSSSINTTAKLQNLVDAFIAIREAADGNTTTAIPSLSQAQYAAIGVSSTLASSLLDVENLRLMNDIVGSKLLADVDTVTEINNLARIVKGIQDTAAGLTVTPALTAQDLLSIGISGVTPDNLSGVLAQIDSAANDGSQTSTVSDLQAFINRVNYAPTNTVPATVTVNEDTGPHYINGLAVSDGDAGTGSLTVVLTAPNGSLNVAAAAGVTLTNNGSASVTLTGTLSNINAALGDNKIAWTPASGYYGSASFTLQTTDTAPAGTSNGNLSDSDSFQIGVTPVPDAPAGASKAVTFNEDGSYTFAAADFGFSDNEGVMPANAFDRVKITTLPDVTKGSLKLNGLAVTAGQQVAVSDLGNLVYTPNANANGSAYSSFTFQVMDNGGTANGGSNIDPSPRVFTFNVNPVAEIVSNGVVIDNTQTTGSLNNFLSAGDTVTVMVTFDQAVTVSGTGTARPSIDLDIGGTVVKAYYDSAKSTLSAGKVAFSYQILVNQIDPDGIAIPANGVKLNGGSILSVGNGTVAAMLDHAQVAANASYKVDAVDPLLSDISADLLHDATNDTGTSATDNLTRNTTPTFKGTVEAGNSVRVTIGSETYDSTVAGSGLTVNAAGQWTLVIPAAKALLDSSVTNGSTGNSGTVYLLNVSSTDLAGNVTTKTSAYSFTLDTQTPAAANVTGQLSLLSDTGVGNDHTTSQTRPTLSGTAEAGTVVKVVIDVPASVDASGQLTYTVTADATGSWSLPVTSALVDGSYTFTVTSTDAAGNATTKNGTAFTVDTSNPTGSANLVHDVISDTAGPSGFTNGTNSDNITNNTMPTIEGQIGDATTPYSLGDQVRVVLGAEVYSSEAAEDSSGTARIHIDTSTGHWTFASASLSAGDYMPSVAVKGYNQSSYGTALNGTGFRVDTSASTFGVSGALTIDTDTNNNTADDNDSGTKGDNLTRDTTPTIKGTAEAGATVAITLNDSTVSRATPLASIVLPKVIVAADGTWTVTVPSALADGQWTPSIVVTDIAGNSSSAVNGTAFTIDSTSPTGQTGALAAASDIGNGVSGTTTDNRTSLTNPTLSGTAEAGSSVEVSVGGRTYTTTANASTGAWSVLVSDALTDSTGATSYTPSIKVTDKAGNTSTVNGTAFVLDLLAPASASITGALKADAANDSATLGDNTTNVRLPTLTGVTESATDKVEVIVNGKIYAATVSGTSWSVQVGSLDNGGAGLAGGSYTPQIKVTDAAGNVTTKDGTAFTVDYTPPASTFITGALTIDASTNALTANDSGTKGDNLTRNNTPTLSGTGEANATVVVTLKDTTAGRSTPLTNVVINGITVGSDGNWTASVPAGTPLGDGQWTASVAMTDKAGNTTTKDVTPFTVDRTAPTGQTGALAAASDIGNGVSGTTTDNRTSLTNPTLSGTAEAGSSVEVTVGGHTYTTTANASTGAWSVLVSDALTDSTGATSYTPSIKVTDKAGNTSTVNGTAFVLDLLAPASASITGALKADAANDSATLGDNTTNVRLPTLTGVTESATDKVEVIVNGKIYAATVSGTSWSVQVGSLDNGGTGLAGGSYTPQIKVTDAAGNVTTKDGTAFTVDYTPPTASGISGALMQDADTNALTANDSGTKGDNLTRNNTPTLSGTGEANATVVVTLKDTTAGRSTPLANVVINGITVGSDGNWTASVPAGTPLGDGQWTASVAMTDKAGNTTTKDVTPFTVDRTAPTGQTGALAAASDSGNGASGTTTDNRTSLASPTLSGTAEAGSSVEVTVGGHTYTTTANASTGVWSVLVADPLSDASVDRKGTSYTPSIKVTDKAGNTSTVNGTAFVVDTQATADASITGGLSAGATISLSSTPVLTGNAEAGTGNIVIVSLGGKTYSSNVPGSGLTLNAATGVWTLAVPASNSLAAGTYAPQITVVDAAGNSSSTVTGSSFTVSITLNGELKHDAANDTAGASTGTNADNITKNTTPTLTGQAPVNNEVELTLNGKTYKSTLGQISVDYNTGSWSFTLPLADALTTDQTYPWSLKSIDRNNTANVLTTSGTPFTLDHAAPSVAVTDLTGGLSSTVDSGAKGDGITSGVVGGVAQTNVILTGSVEPNAEVAVVLWDNTTSTQVWASSSNAIASSQGVWTVTGPAFSSLVSNHVYAIKITPSDKAGNLAAQTTVGTFTYDTSKPVFGSITLSGLDQGGSTTQTSLLTAGDVLVVTAQTSGNEPLLLGGTGKPNYQLSLDSGVVTATYDADASNLSTGKMVFKYTVRTGDLDSAGGVTASSARLTIPATATLRDTAGNDLDITASGVPSLTANTVTVDAVAPVLQSLVITPKAGNAALVVGDTVKITASFDSPVTTGGDASNLPYVSFKLGSTILNASYDAVATAALADATKMVFSYSISSSSVGDDPNGLSLLANALSTGDGLAWIRDTAGNDAKLTSAAVLDNANLIVDTTAPTVAISRLGTYTITQTNATVANNSDTIKFVFSENPGSSFALSDITVKNGAGTMLVAGTDFTWGTLSGPTLNATSGKYEATVTFTPKSTWAYTGNVTFNVLASAFTDLAGNNSGASNTLTVAVDNQTPAAPAVGLSADSFSVVNSGGSASDKITNTTTLTTAAAELGGTVQYKLEKMVSGSYVDQNIGVAGWGSLADYSAYMDALTSAGDAQYRVSTRQIDSSGNIGGALSSPLVFTRDTSVSGTVTTVLTSDSKAVDAASNSLSAAYASDKVTNNAQLEITGFESGAVVQYRVGGSPWTVATLSGSKYLVTDANIAGAGNTTDNGKAYSISLRQIDLAGNVRDETTIDLIRDVVAPNVTNVSPNALTARLNVDSPSDVTPMDNLAATHNDSGIKGDNITADNTPTLSGSGEPGAWITVILKNTANPNGGATGLAADVKLTPVQIQADGTWTITAPSALADGTWAPTVYVQDAAGNTASASTVSNTGLQAFTIDTTAPVLTVSATRVGGSNNGAVFTLGTDKLFKGEGLLVTFAFDDDILSDSFTQGDLTVTGGVLSNFARMATPPAGYKAAWTATYSPTDGVDAGTGGITVAAASLQNVAAVALGSAVARSIGYDTNAPDIVSIKRGVSVPNGSDVTAAYKSDAYLNKLETNEASDAVTFLVKFNQNVFGVSGSNFVLKDLAGNAIAGLVYSVSGSGTDWTVTVSGLNTLNNVSGVRLDLANRSGIADAVSGGNSLLSTTYGNGETFTVDQTAPALASLTSSATVGTGSPVLTGRAEAGATVIVSAGGATFTTTASDSGVWSVDTSSNTGRTGTFTPMSGASNAVSITPVDAAGNSGNASSYNLSVVVGTPVITTSGVSNDSTPSVEGTTSANGWVRVTIGGASYDVQANASGLWTLDTGSKSPNSGSFNEVLNGNYSITAQTVSGNNGSTSGGTATATLLIDTIAPSAPTITSSPFTNDSTPTLTGTATAGAKVRVGINGSSYDILADSLGVWTLNIDNTTSTGVPSTTAGVRVSGGGYTSDVPVGTRLTNGNATGTVYAVTAREMDAAGNQSAAANQNLVFDNQAPANPTIDSGVVLTSGNTAPVVSGTGEAGAQITLVISGATYQTTVGTNGRWSVATASETPVSGAYMTPNAGASVVAYVRQTDAAGNINPGSTSSTASSWMVNQTYVYDNSYPAITSSDFTNDTTPVVSGTGPVGSSVDVAINGATYRTSVGVDGKWSVNTETATPISGSFSVLNNGNNYAVTATITSTTKTTGQNLTVDTQAPSSLSINAIAGDDFINQTEKGNVTVTGMVEIGAEVTLNIAGNLRTATVKTDGTWSYQLTSADYTALSESGTTGDLSIIAIAKDKAGNQLIRTRNFTMDSIAPVVDLDRASANSNYSLALTAKNVALGLDNGTALNVTDASVTEVGSISAVKIAFQQVTAAGSLVGFMPQDGANEQLLIGDQVLNLDGTNLPTQLNYGGVLWYIDYAAGNFTLTAATVASSAAAQAMLRNIRYINKDASTTADDNNRVFSFQLVDQAGNISTAVTATVSADAVPPTLDLNGPAAGTGNTGTFGLGSGANAFIANAAVLDEASKGNSKINAIDLSVTGVMDGNLEKIVVNGATGATTSFAIDGSVTSGSFTLSGLNWIFKYDATAKDFTFQLADGSKATDSQAQALVQSFKYQHDTGTITDGARSFKFNATDGVGNSMASTVESVLSYSGSTPPTLAAVSPLVTADANADGVLGDQFTLNFSELVRVSNIVNAANWSVQGTTTLVNGSFDTSSNWTAVNSNFSLPGYNSSAKRWEFNVDRADANAGGTLNSDYFATVVGAVYTVTFKVGSTVAGSSGAIQLTAQDSSGNGISSLTGNSSSLTGDTWTYSFAATTNTTRLSFFNTGATANANMWLDDVVLTSPSLSGATITAKNVQTINGVDYAKSYVVSGATNLSGDHQAGATGSANLLESQLTIGAANVVDTTGTTAAAAVVFTMTDITAPTAPTPPLNINQNSATSQNVINASEKAGITDFGVDHLARIAGDTFLIYRDGVDITSQVTVVNTSSTRTTFRLSGNAWGADGAHTFTVRQYDAAGNFSGESSPKSVQVDTVLSNGLSSALVGVDGGVVGTPEANDTVIVTFNEAVSIPTTSAAGLPSIFGTSGATATAIGGVSGLSTTWRITLGTNPDVAMAGKSVTFTGVADAAGNTGNISATLPTDLFNAPGTPVIGMVTADNIIDGTERGAAQSISITLTNAKVGDVVKLYMDGLQVGTATVTTNGQSSASISIAANAWGADGERTLSATVQRGSGTVVNAEATRHVFVQAEASHWSAAAGAGNVLWFNTDTLGMNLGATVNTWTSTVGGITTNEQGTLGSMTKVMDGNGRYAIRATGGSELKGSTGWTTDWVSGMTEFSMAKILNSTTAWQYTFTHDTNRNGVTWERTQFGIQGGGTNLTFHNPADAPGSALSNGVTVNTWTALLGYSSNNVRTVGVNGYLSGTPETLDIGTTGSIWNNQGLFIGGTGNNGSVTYETINGILGDQISFKVGLGNAYRQEVATYLGQKFMSAGAAITPTTVGATYDLGVSNTSTVLLNDVLDLANSKGIGNDTVMVAGSDWVNAGAGNDLVLAKDLMFRSLDGGQGYDTFALSASYNNAVSGNKFILTDYVSNARGISGGISGTANAADTRVNANGYHKLMGFEKLDFSQASGSQTLQLAFADIDQLAEKNLAQGTGVTVNNTTSNLFVALGNNDWLDVTGSGLGNVKYGFWQDANGTAYDRRYSGAVGSDTATLYVRGGDDAPDFGATSTTAVVGAGSVTVDFNEVLGNFSGTAALWTLASAGSTISSWATATTEGKTTLTLSGTFNQNAYLDITYTGTAIVDGNGDQLRYKGIAIGIATADSIDLSGKSQPTNAAFGAGYAIYGNDGRDVIKGTNWDDLIVGGAGNDNLTGGAGADTFRAIQYEGGIDTVTDFLKTDGDKIDLRGILKGTAIDGALVWNADGTITTTSLAQLNKYVDLSTSGTTVVLKVDDNGLSGFAAPGYQMLLQSANVAGNLGAMDLQALVNQKVILV